MKKILVILILAFGLISCGKTEYKDLPKEEKVKIQAEAIGLTFKEFGNALGGKKSGEKPIEKALIEKYPEVDFGDFSDFSDDLTGKDGLGGILKGVKF